MCYQSLCSLCIVIILKKFEDLIFVVDKIPTQEAKIITFKHSVSIFEGWFSI